MSEKVVLISLLEYRYSKKKNVFQFFNPIFDTSFRLSLLFLFLFLNLFFFFFSLIGADLYYFLKVILK